MSLDASGTRTTPTPLLDREKMGTVRWLKPRLLCEVAFNEQTAHGHVGQSQ